MIAATPELQTVVFIAWCLALKRTNCFGGDPHAEAGAEWCNANTIIDLTHRWVN